MSTPGRSAASGCPPSSACWPGPGDRRRRSACPRRGVSTSAKIRTFSSGRQGAHLPDVAAVVRVDVDVGIRCRRHDGVDELGALGRPGEGHLFAVPPADLAAVRVGVPRQRDHGVGGYRVAGSAEQGIEVVVDLAAGTVLPVQVRIQPRRVAGHGVTPTMAGLSPAAFGAGCSASRWSAGWSSRRCRCRRGGFFVSQASSAASGLGSLVPRGGGRLGVVTSGRGVFGA